MNNAKQLASQPTPQARAFMDASLDMLVQLYVRWQDESKYEDIQTYRAVIDPIAERCGVKIMHMNKRPFGLQFSVGEKEFVIDCNSRTAGYKRVK